MSEVRGELSKATHIHKNTLYWINSVALAKSSELGLPEALSPYLHFLL